MIVEFGFGMVVAAFVLALYGAGAALMGIWQRDNRQIESARRAMLLSGPLLSLAVGCLMWLLAAGHYEVAYVYSVTSDSMPVYLRLTALWGGQAGSLLFWAWLMGLGATLAALRRWDEDLPLLPWVIAVILATLVFFLGIVLFIENPFERFWLLPTGREQIALFQPGSAVLLTPPDGNGMNPLLRHVGMVFHPPLLYLGFVGFIVPFALAIATLATRRSDDHWVRLTRPWALGAWFFLSLGLVSGMRWAYDVLGWGGYWSWDPVEIAALLPWLTGTAFLHSIMMEERAGLFKRWNLFLIILSYALVIYGTFITRSGVISSVHAFSESATAPFFLGFIALILGVSAWLLISRWQAFKGEGELHSWFSREGMFLINTLLFISLLVVCFWGVNFSMLSELFADQKVTVGPEFYERATAPIFLALLLMMGLVPLSLWGRFNGQAMISRLRWPALASAVFFAAGAVLSRPAALTEWLGMAGLSVAALAALVTLGDTLHAVLARRRSSGEHFLVALAHLARKNRRRYGGYLIHLAIVMMALGIIGIEVFQTQTQGTLKTGETLSLRGYTLTYESLSEQDTIDGRNEARAVLTLSNGETLYPRRDYYYEAGQMVTVPALHSTLADDLYVVLVDWQPISSDGATFKVYHNPLFNWLWIGTVILMFGTLLAAWPERRQTSLRSSTPHERQ